MTLRAIALVVIAFSAARWAAMGFNRIADRAFDARNPRTAQRELPRGAITLTQAWASVIVASAIFLLAAGSLNPLCLVLSPLALAWILIYSLTKRFTWWPHLWLGLSLAIAPVGGYLAVTGPVERPRVAAVRGRRRRRHLGGGLRHLLRPARRRLRSGRRVAQRGRAAGRARAILLAKLLHGVTIPALALFGYGVGFGLWYYAGLFAAAAILAYEHSLVRPGDLSRLDAAFFTMNGIMSVTVFAFALLDRLAA